MLGVSQKVLKRVSDKGVSALTAINDNLGKIQGNFQEVVERFEGVEKRMEAIEKKLEAKNVQDKKTE